MSIAFCAVKTRPIFRAAPTKYALVINRRPRRRLEVTSQAEATFKFIRWADTNGAPVCPACGSVEAYEARRPNGALRFRCKGCKKDFTITSGTLFASHKLPLRGYLAAIAVFCNEVKGKSALALSRDLGLSYKSAFVLLHKLREAMAEEMKGRVVGGEGKEAEVDGGYFGGYVKPANLKEDRIDRRFARNQNGKRKVVVIIRERGGNSVPAVFHSESQASAFIRSRIAKGTVVHADEAGSWDNLHERFEVKRINHQEAYSLDGACTNWAEEYFSRLRRAEVGIHHHIAGAYLLRYAQESSWREDNRRVSNGDQVSRVAALAMKRGKSVDFTGYWQRYDAAWNVPQYEDGFPRSADDLHLMMMGRYGLPIFHKEFTKLSWLETKFRSIYIPFSDRIDIFYARDMPPRHLRYYKTKELLQIHLWQESLATTDIVDLVQNMILRESPTSIDLNLGHPAMSDTLGEIAAMEYLFPLERRLAYTHQKNGVQHLADLYKIPPFVVQRSLNIIEPLKGFYP